MEVGDSVAFTVVGLPPKKDGASSMWRKNSEVARIISLRLAAAEALGDRPPFNSGIQDTFMSEVPQDVGVGELLFNSMVKPAP